jgi:hypothetical protein
MSANESDDKQLIEAKAVVSSKDWVKGEILWKELVVQRPNQPDMKNGLAFVYENTGRLEDALGLIESALKMAVEMKYPRLVCMFSLVYTSLYPSSHIVSHFYMLYFLGWYYATKSVKMQHDTVCCVFLIIFLIGVVFCVFEKNNNNRRAFCQN